MPKGVLSPPKLKAEDAGESVLRPAALSEKDSFPYEMGTVPFVVPWSIVSLGEILTSSSVTLSAFTVTV
jgi:hypothetical protein